MDALWLMEVGNPYKQELQTTLRWDIIEKSREKSCFPEGGIQDVPYFSCR